jgi:hypothetical protein
MDKIINGLIGEVPVYRSKKYKYKNNSKSHKYFKKKLNEHIEKQVNGKK